MIDFPSKMAIDEVDIRIKEWRLLGLNPVWKEAGSLIVYLDDSGKKTTLVRYRSGRDHYFIRWKMAKKRMNKLLKDHV